ncbi:MAG: PD-(D/E)XK nuclease family protein, partial [Bacteroidetes bacterium]|nr:PD-(D/E)XK nuclease family protein [Bacteroidota bacterium]
MNIFKVLANGDGNINEANVSAFFGYLLNPNEDHGLGYVFLEKVLNSVVDKDNFNARKYDYALFFESAVKDKNDNTKQIKQIVDIVIVAYEIEDTGKEAKAIDFIKGNKKVEYVFLIENKISASPTKNQLQKQFDNAKKELPNNKIYSVYITPNEDKYVQEFNTNLRNENKKHLFWKGKESISNILKDILKEETE